jgi:hypothetical protein
MECIEEFQRPPTYKEICQHLNWHVVALARDRTIALVKKGYLLKDDHAARGLSLNPERYVVKAEKK